MLTNYRKAITLSLLAIAWAPSLSYGLTFEEFRQQYPTLKLPQKQVLKGISISKEGINKYTYTLTRDKSTVTLHNTSKIVTATHVANHAIILQNSERIIHDKNFIEKAERDHIITKRKNDSTMIHKYYLNKKLIKDKVSNYNQNAIDTTLISAFLQQVAFYDIKELSGNLIIEAVPMKTKQEITQSIARDFTKISPEYTLPKELLTYNKLKEDIIVYTMKGKGMAAIFHPHKYYYLFKKDTPHTPLGYWGGPEEFISYGIFPDELPL